MWNFFVGALAIIGFIALLFTPVGQTFVSVVLSIVLILVLIFGILIFVTIRKQKKMLSKLQKDTEDYEEIFEDKLKNEEKRSKTKEADFKVVNDD